METDVKEGNGEEMIVDKVECEQESTLIHNV